MNVTSFCHSISPTKDRTYAPVVEGHSLNHWTAWKLARVKGLIQTSQWSRADERAPCKSHLQPAGVEREPLACFPEIQSDTLTSGEAALSSTSSISLATN